MKAYFGRRYMLSASHRLHSEALSAAENQSAYGKCNNPHGHGHNYIVEVMVAGPVDAATGMVMNMVDLDRVVQAQVLDRFDHANLNLDPLFAVQVQAQVPTTENFCKAVCNLLRPALPAGMLEQVRIEETENNFFEYRGA
ncbi:MAG: 6-carboxytetrahydropterin synthase [Terracidiphilus sp.]|nr:6-carboxytetrahydropterin synthase [Terracidiphilus sp.]